VPTISERLASFVAETRYENLPAEVVRETKRLILDTLGCALGGFTSEPSRIVRQMVRELGGNPEATVLGEGTATSCELATLANGTMIRYLDFNDTYWGRDPGHPSNNIAPALAVGEKVAASGAQVILAVVLGYELQIRLQDHAGTPNLWDRGWDHTTNAQYAVAAVAGKLLNLDAEAMANAFGISGTHNNVLGQLRRGEIPMTKAITHAMVARNGVTAALLAQRGMTAPREIIEGQLGYARAVAGGADLERIAAWDGSFKIMKASMKPFACEFLTMAPVQAALEHRANPEFDLRQVEKIVIRFHEYALKKPSWDPLKLTPQTRETADHSYTYCVARALLDGEVGPAQFTNEKVFDPAARELMAKMELVVDPELTKLYPETYPAAVEMHMKDGKRLEVVVTYPPGHPKNRLTDEQVQAKFRKLASPLLNEKRVQEVIGLIMGLEEMGDIGEMMEALVL